MPPSPHIGPIHYKIHPVTSFFLLPFVSSLCHHQRVLTTQNTQHTACSEVVNDIFIHLPKLWGESSSKQCQNKIFHIFFSRFSLCLPVRSRIWIRISKRHERWREKKSGWMSKRNEKISRYLQKCVIDTIRHRAVQECFNSSDILYLWLQILVGLFSHTYTCSERWHVKTRGERSVKEMINLFSMGYDHTSQLGRLCEEDNKFLHKKVRENFSISTFLATPPICLIIFLLTTNIIPFWCDSFFSLSCVVCFLSRAPHSVIALRASHGTARNRLGYTQHTIHHLSACKTRRNKYDNSGDWRPVKQKSGDCIDFAFSFKKSLTVINL